VTAFTFSSEQLRTAPLEVRRWVAAEIAHALAGVAAPQPEMPRPPTQAEPPALAACTPGEALQIFELIGGDPIVGRIFFELARDNTVDSGMPGLHMLRIADLMRHAGIADNEAAVAGLSTIGRAFRQVRGEPGNLFGLGDAGELYVHAATQASIRRVWEELIRARTAADRPTAPHAGPATPDFVPPHLGPSEDVATHDRHPSPKGNFTF
jgi:hypothetical protein